MKYTSLCSILCISLFFISCDKEDTVQKKGDEGNDQHQVEVTDVEQVAEANRAFGLELFRKEVEQSETDENVLISPLSIHTALNMALNGAAGDTRSEMLETMHAAGWSVEQLNQRQAEWRRLLKKQSGHPTLTEANGLFKDPNRLVTKDAFESALSEYYEAVIQSYDFTDPSTKDEINGWVKENTGDKIEQIVDEIKQEDIAFLINAIYFKADWARGFAEDMTYQDVFHLSGGNTVQVPYVNGDDYFHWYEDDNFWAVDLPFKDSTFSLTFLRPKEGVHFTKYWIDGLNTEFFDRIYGQLNARRAHVHFPKMKLTYKNELSESLKTLGMELAFRPFQADLSNIGTSPIGGNIYLTRVQHKSVLEVDEQGAEGAAATSVGVGVTSAPPQIKFNREFILVLRHIETNTPVFIGRVSNPAEDS